MHLTLVIYAMGAGGAEKIMSLIANYWAAKGWQVTLLTMSDKPSFYKLHPAVKFCPLSLAGVSANKLAAASNNLKRLYQLRKAIKATAPDVVISFINVQNILTLLALWGTKIPVIVSEHTEPTQAYDMNRIWKLLHKTSYRLAAKIVILTDFAKGYFPQNLQQKIVVIPNPAVLPDDFRLEQRPISTADGKIIALGRLVEPKGFDLLLTAFSQLAPHYPGWSLEIWGEGPERARLEALRAKLGLDERVQMPGLTNQPLEKLKQADLFVLSSRREGFPTVLWEAMACGLPVISFDCATGPSTIVRDKLDGRLVPPEDTTALAATIAQLINNPAERSKLAARAPEVLQRFNIEKIMRQWEVQLATVNLANPVLVQYG